jgi:single-strand DNA-binding protein
MSFNKATLLGNLGADPEIRTLNSGNRVANLRLATSESWKDKSTGERKEVTEWHRVVIFNDNIVKLVEQYVSKGDTILVEGQIKTRKWQDKDGSDKYSTEIEIGAFKGSLTLVKTKGRGDDQGTSGRSAQQSFQPGLDDEIPF